MKLDLPIPAELTRKLDDTAATMHRIECLLRHLVIIETAKLTVDQRRAIERHGNELLNETLKDTA